MTRWQAVPAFVLSMTAITYTSTPESLPCLQAVADVTWLRWEENRQTLDRWCQTVGPPAVVTACLGALANIKNVFVVDPDIDIFSDQQMDWALATRFQPDRDLIVMSGTRTLPLDPSLPAGTRVGAKAGFDLTWTFGTAGRYEQDFFGASDVGQTVAVTPGGAIVVAGGVRNGTTPGYGLMRLAP